MESRDGGINTALLAALPPASKVLELGCADGRLGARYKEANPTATWIGVDRDAGTLGAAGQRLDGTALLDLENDPITAAGRDFDLIVLGDVLEHLTKPERILSALHDVSTGETTLALCMPNMSHISVIERIVSGDIMYDEVGLLDKTHLRMFSPRSVFKMLLDCGWLPTAAGAYNARHSNERFARAILEAGEALGIPKHAAEANVFTYQLVIVCRPSDPSTSSINANVAAIVPVSNESQLSLNASRSPGLSEIGAQTFALRGAASAAAARAAIETQTDADWLLFCEQDVYVPAGSGRLLCEALAGIDPSEFATAVVGFAGITLDAASQVQQSGVFVERFKLYDFPATQRAVSIADWAVVLHRSCVLRIDPRLEWNLWATDLCLQSLAAGGAPRVPRIPVFHNTVEDSGAGEGFARSAAHLAAKYPAYPAIPTPYGLVRSQPGG